MSDRNNFAAKFRLYFQIMMAALYALAGIILIFVWSPGGLSDLNRIILGLVLIFYSVFRSYKLSR